MPERERTDAGTFAEKVTLEDVRDVFDAVRGPVVTSSDVAEHLDCTTESARQKLTRLYDQGEVDKRKTGRTVVWWFTGGEPITADERRVTPPEEPADTDTPETPPAGENANDGAENGLVDDVRAYLGREGVPPKTAHGRGAVLDVFRHLREHGTTSTGDLQESVYTDYTEEWGSARTMWNAIDRYLADIPGIEKGGYGEWEYSGDERVRATLDGSRE